MADQNFMYNSEFSVNLLSKSSPSQFQQFQFNNNIRPRIQNENLYSKTPINNKPSNLSHVPCKFYKQGACTAGANCTFSHSSDFSSQAAVCKYYLKGNCKFGTKCALLHTMSSLGNSKSSNHSNRFIAMTPPNQSTLMEYQPMLSPPITHDAFGSSAPAVSFIHDPSTLWRNNNSSNFDFIGFHSSPRESSSSSMDYLLGTSPFSQQVPPRLSSSLKNTAIDDVNDVMLPSSLHNDVFTPNEIQQRRAARFSEAINIPNHHLAESHSHHSSISSTSSQKKPSVLLEDDEVQFYMEDDEALIYDHKMIDKITTNDHFSSRFMP